MVINKNVCSTNILEAHVDIMEAVMQPQGCCETNTALCMHSLYMQIILIFPLQSFRHCAPSVNHLCVLPILHNIL